MPVSAKFNDIWNRQDSLNVQGSTVGTYRRVNRSRNTILYALVQQDTTRCQKKNNMTMPTAICYSASNSIPIDKIEYFARHVPVKFSYTANTLS